LCSHLFFNLLKLLVQPLFALLERAQGGGHLGAAGGGPESRPAAHGARGVSEVQTPSTNFNLLNF
jgi:hypothetical protein